jgi:E3 ubiquitin-protein ligase DOA10
MKDMNNDYFRLQTEAMQSLAAAIMGIVGSMLLLTLVIYLLGYLILYLALLLNRVVWPITRGLVRALYEYDIMKRKKFLLYAGLTLLYLTLFPGLRIEAIMKFVESLF